MIFTAHGSKRERLKKRFPERVRVMSIERSRQGAFGAASPWRALERISKACSVEKSRKTAASLGRYLIRSEEGEKIISSTCST